MEKQPFVRPSSIDLLMRCPSSAELASWKHRQESAAADLGSAVHMLMADVVRGSGRLPIDKVLSRFPETDETELMDLLARGKRIWSELKAQLPKDAEVRVEQPISADWTGGTPDVLILLDDCVIVLDWKSGWRTDKSHRWQLLTYLWLARYQMTKESRRLEDTDYQYCVGWLRTGAYEVAAADDEALDDLHATVVGRFSDIGQTYGPGEGCVYCHRYLTCEARQEQHRDALAIFGGQDLEPTPEALVALYPKAQAAEKALSAYKTALRAALAQGEVPTPEGKVMRLAERNRETIIGSAVWPILQAQGWTPEELAQAGSYSKAGLRTVLRTRHDTDAAREAELALWSALREGGAVVEKGYSTIETRKGSSNGDG